MTTRSSSFAAAALLVVVAVGGFQSSLRADVVFGNLGDTGTGNLGAFVTDFGDDSPITDATQRLAVGFTTGTSTDFLTLESVTLGLFGATPPASPVSISVAIYGNDSGKPASTPLHTSDSQSVGGTAKYTFNFTGSPQLTASTAYWIVPEPVTTGSWANEAFSSTPSGRNGSGYSFDSALRYGILSGEDSTLGWYSAFSSGMAVSVNAVPEPGTVGLAIAGLAACGFAFARRLMAGR